MKKGDKRRKSNTKPLRKTVKLRSRFIKQNFIKG